MEPWKKRKRETQIGLLTLLAAAIYAVSAVLQHGVWDITGTSGPVLAGFGILTSGAILDLAMMAFGLGRFLLQRSPYNLIEEFRGRSPPRESECLGGAWWKTAGASSPGEHGLPSIPAAVVPTLFGRSGATSLQRIRLGGDFLTHLFVDPILILIATISVDPRKDGLVRELEAMNIRVVNWKWVSVEYLEYALSSVRRLPWKNVRDWKAFGLCLVQEFGFWMAGIADTSGPMSLAR